MKIEITLPPATILFIETDDDFRQRAVMSDANMQEVSTYMLGKLKTKPHLAGLLALGKAHPYPHVQVVAVEPRRITRWGKQFAGEFPAAIDSITTELGKATPTLGNVLLEVAYTDEENFNGSENHYADFGYLYARLIVTKT